MSPGSAARQEVKMKEPNVSLEMNPILGTEERINHFGLNFITNGTGRSSLKFMKRTKESFKLSKIELKKITWRKFSKFSPLLQYNLNKLNFQKYNYFIKQHVLS